MAAERHGIERLRWLEGVPTDPTEVGFSETATLLPHASRIVYLSETECQIEIAKALIEELHDFTALLHRLREEAEA